MAKSKANPSLKASTTTKPSKFKANGSKTSAKKVTVKPTGAKQTKPTKSPVKSVSTRISLAKKLPAKQTLIEELNALNMPAQTNTIAKLWTPTLAQDFYTNVNALSKKLDEQHSARLPENYRARSDSQRNSDDYALLYEEELHLADHFAFLAHVAEGVEYVSATTIEQSSEPIGFTIRLASNHTPIPKAVDGLRKILKLVREHAHAGRNSREYKARLFNEVVRFSQKRIYGRMRCSKWEKPAHLRSQNLPPLHVQIEKLLVRLGPGAPRTAFVELIQSLKSVDLGTPDDQIELLKEVILKSHAVSHQGEAKSLETLLPQLKVPPSICESRAVLEIDKLSQYLDLCDYLIRLSRQPATRQHCQNLSLEICLACPSSRPSGAKEVCFVHAEVQLILYYELHPKQPPPRAIGASKTACFLCDQFIRNHNAFGISYSHMRLYPKWTLPETAWMSAQQIQSFRKIILAMTSDIGRLVRQQFYSYNTAVESRAHLLEITYTSPIASSLPSPVSSKLQVLTSPENGIPTISSVTEACSVSAIPVPTLYSFQDLPITIDILPNTASCILFVGKVDYIFDLAEVETGSLHISEVGAPPMESVDQRIDIRELESKLERRVKSVPASEKVTFTVHDARMYELRVTLIWGRSRTLNHTGAEAAP